MRHDVNGRIFELRHYQPLTSKPLSSDLVSMAEKSRNPFPYPEIRKRRGVPQRTKAKDIVMDAFDEAILTFALREAFDAIRIIEPYSWTNPPPKLPERESIAVCECGDADVFAPIVEPTEKGKRKRPRRLWQQFVYRRSVWIYGGRDSERWSLSLPTLQAGSIQTAWYVGDEQDAATVRTVWRIIARLGTRRVKHRYPRLGEGPDEMEIQSDAIFGHHALEWCAREPTRVLEGRCRPAEGWRVPQSEWYQKLRRKVLERYGETLEDPGPPEILERGAYAPINYGDVWEFLV